MSPELSRRPSDEADRDHTLSGVATPFSPGFAEVETLSRVPSYTTAVRTTLKPREPGLPEYDAVVTGDISPPPESPQHVDLGSGRRSP